MQRISSLIFCTASLIMVVMASWLIYPWAARSSQDLQYTSTPQGAEMFDDVDLGDFGSVSVLDMMQHYIEDPPPEPAGGAKKVRFQGC